MHLGDREMAQCRLVGASQLTEEMQTPCLLWSLVKLFFKIEHI